MGPEHVYACLADYRTHHPQSLPPAFGPLAVLEGGIGAGTLFTVELTAGGRTRGYRMRVTEPEPGRVLVERDESSGLVTTFTVTPSADGATAGAPASMVRIETTWTGAGGIPGFFERLFAPLALRRLYRDELARLDAYARRTAAG